MPQGLQALIALLVLLPGFVSARIVRMMSAKSQQTDVERVIEALIFSFFIYVCYVLLFRISLRLGWAYTTFGGQQHYTVTVDRWHLLSLTAIALVLGFSWGFVRGHDLLLKLLRKLKLTQRSSRESVWADVFIAVPGDGFILLTESRRLSTSCF